jgi:hypothetical protein
MTIVDNIPSLLWNFVLVYFQKVKKEQHTFRFIVLFCNNFKDTPKNCIE